MRLLLDTSTLIFSAVEPHRLSVLAKREIVDPGNELWISAVSAYEVVQKHRRGKLSFAATDYRHAMSVLRVRPLPVTDDHALEAGGISSTHNDPWDRIIAAQARMEGLPVLTPDNEIAALGAKVVW